MANVIEFQNFSFRYPKMNYDIIHNANFAIQRGDCVLIFGPSGAGKSTLCYSLSSLIPWSIKGFFKGNVSILGQNTTEVTPKMLAGSVGLVLQNPDNQFVNLTVFDELVFAAENLKVPEELIKKRLDRIVDLLDLKYLLDRNVMQLSGGEKQRVILGSVLMMKPKILILDEPLASLDGPGRLELLHHISKLRKKFSEQLTILIAEHRIPEILPIANKFLLVDQGKIELYSSINDIREEFFQESCKSDDRQVNEQNYSPIEPANFSYDSIIRKFSFQPQTESSKLEFDSSDKKALISFENVSFNYIIDLGKYNRQIKRVFDKISFKIFPGEIIGIVGSNGSGKTTLLYLIAGVLRSSEGRINYKEENLNEIQYAKYARNIGLIFQNPESQILKNTITKELEFGPKNFGLGEHLNKDVIDDSINLIFSSEEKTLRNRFGKEPLAELNPFNLSWGQKRRLNLASLYTYSPTIYLLDEPFTGQDTRMRKEIMTTLLKILGDDKAAVISTHDEELLRYCRKVFLIEDMKLKIYEKKGIGNSFPEVNL